MFYCHVEGVDCFEVGIQQLIDFMGWRDCVRDHGWDVPCGMYSYINEIAVGDYVLVQTLTSFGHCSKPVATQCFRTFEDALRTASALVAIEDEGCDSDSGYWSFFSYELWNVVDDGDLWQAWDHDSELSRVDAPVLLDERDIDGVELDHEQLWSLNVPGVGPVSFLWYLRRGELVEEYCIDDWQGNQPRCLKGVGWYNWLSVEDMLACVESYEMLRDAGSLDVGGRVGADF